MRRVVRDYRALPALAYLDAGTAAIVVQCLFAGILGAGFLVKTYWQKIKSSMARLAKRGKVDEGKDDGDA